MSVELTIPALGESIAEATIAKWLKQVGDAVQTDETVAELETDKVTVSLPAPQGGVLASQRYPTGATVRVGDSIGTIDEGQQAQGQGAPTPGTAGAAPAQVTVSATPAQTSAPAAPSLAAPAAPSLAGPPLQPGAPLSPTMRRLLREQGGDGHGRPPAAAAMPPQVAASTPSTAPTSTPSAAAPASTPPATTPRPPSGRPEEIVPMSPLRKRIAERLVQAQHTAAILTTFNEADMSQIMSLRSRFQDEFVKRHGVKLGFMSFFVRACVDALVAYPGVNAEVRGGDIVYKKYYDLGIAVGSGKGLVVPVLRGADRLSFAEIERDIAALAQKAKDSKLTLDDLAGGTFSITNGGVYGSMMSTPLLNMPQTGILGMHNIIRRPIAVGDEVAIRPMMYLALSYDHRVVDGREAVQFLVHVKERLEQPDKLLLSV